MSELPERLVESLNSCRTLPSMPAVVLEVLDLCQNDNLSIPEVSRSLERDPALSAKVLKIANSAWYGLRSQVTTLDRALALLGINATLSLALSFSLVRSLGQKTVPKFDHQAYWRRSAIAGVAARIIGVWVEAASRDELFLAGLLQDIGMLALNESVPETYGPIVAESKGNHSRLVALEKEKLGADHAAVGAWLLARWNLPENLRNAIALSHVPEFPRLQGADAFIRSVSLAGEIAEIWASPDTDAATARARESSISLFEVSQEQFDGLLKEVAAALPEATASLDIDIGGEEGVNRILDQAREALVVLSLKAQRKAEEFQERSQLDPLTSLYNRAYLDEMMPQHFEAARKLAQPLSIIFLDLDNFKQINDTYGHHAGDCVLAWVARILGSQLRRRDIVGRYGGEEFLCLLPNTPAEGAELVAERMRAAVASDMCDVRKKFSIQVTISAGCATAADNSDFADCGALLRAADRCLYAAKRNGRNRVSTFERLQSAESVA